jgi:hypothetical protein
VGCSVRRGQVRCLALGCVSVEWMSVCPSHFRSLGSFRWYLPVLYRGGGFSFTCTVLDLFSKKKVLFSSYSAERGAIPPLPQYTFRAWCSVKEQEQLFTYEGVSKSCRTGCLERELQMVQLFATRRSCSAISWVSLVSFAAITLYVASQQVFIVVVYFVIDSVRKLLDTLSYVC